MSDSPTIGRIVHLVEQGDYGLHCRAAIVVEVCDEDDCGEGCTETERCTVVAFGPSVLSWANAEHAEPVTGHRIPGTWHWPERVEPVGESAALAEAKQAAADIEAETKLLDGRQADTPTPPNIT